MTFDGIRLQPQQPSYSDSSSDVLPINKKVFKPDAESSWWLDKQNYFDTITQSWTRISSYASSLLDKVTPSFFQTDPNTKTDYSLQSALFSLAASGRAPWLLSLITACSDPRDECSIPTVPSLVDAAGESMRIGTYNGQFLPWAFRKTRRGCCDDMACRGFKLADRILHSGYDVIALNEMFTDSVIDGEVQTQLVELLKDKYPHYLKFVEAGPGGFLGFFDWTQDSGLMLFSKFPFESLSETTHLAASHNLKAASDGSNWEHVAYIEFSESSGFDRLSDKGVVLIRVRHPATDNIWSIVLTHLNASEPPIRRAQIEEIRQVIDETLTAAQLQSDHIVILGDFNINGYFDAYPNRNEWESHFDEDPERLFSDILPQGVSDTWEHHIYSSLVEQEYRDRGITDNPSGTVSERKRLDYILRGFATDAVTNRELCYQHMTIAYNLAYSDTSSGEEYYEGGMNFRGIHNLSDHYGVNADINHWAPYCSSREAYVVGADDFPKDTFSVNFEGEPFRITHPGNMQWFYLNEPGTYSFALYKEDGTPAGPTDVRLRIYASDEISVPLLPSGETTDFFTRDASGTLIQHEGIRYHIPHQKFYLRISHPDRSYTGAYKLAIHRHACVSQRDACEIIPNHSAPERFPFPDETTIGWEGVLWYTLTTDAPYFEAAQVLQFFARESPEDDPSSNFSLELRADDGRTELERSGTGVLDPSTGQAFIERSDIADNRRKMYMLVRPVIDVLPESIYVGWSTNLQIFHSTTEIPFLLRCIGQTKDDRIGDDDNIKINFKTLLPNTSMEESLKVYATEPDDLRPQLGDFDTGQSKVLEHIMRCPLGFLDEVPYLELEESDSGRLFGRTNDILVGRLGGIAGGSLLQRYALEREDNGPVAMTSTAIQQDRSRPPGIGGFYGPISNTGKYKFNFNVSHGTHGLFYYSARQEDGVPVCEPRPRFE